MFERDDIRDALRDNALPFVFRANGVCERIMNGHYFNFQFDAFRKDVAADFDKAGTSRFTRDLIPQSAGCVACADLFQRCLVTNASMLCTEEGISKHCPAKYLNPASTMWSPRAICFWSMQNESHHAGYDFLACGSMQVQCQGLRIALLGRRTRRARSRLCEPSRPPMLRSLYYLCMYAFIYACIYSFCFLYLVYLLYIYMFFWVVPAERQLATCRASSILL